jgi:hypothetical protein
VFYNEEIAEHIDKYLHLLVQLVELWRIQAPASLWNFETELFILDIEDVGLWIADKERLAWYLLNTLLSILLFLFQPYLILMIPALSY